MTEPRRDRTGEPIDSIMVPRVMREPADPQERARYHLRWVKHHGLESFAAQVADSALMVWASNLVQQYSGMAHPTTGHTMPWWEARQLMMDQRGATAASAYNQAPEAYKERNPPAGNLQPVVQRVTAHLSQEPGDEDPLAI